MYDFRKLSKAEKRDLWIPSTVQGARQVWQELVNALKEVSRHPPTKTFKLMVVRT